MNFTYEVTKPPDNKFGGITKDGSWNGMVKELINKRADIGKGSIFFSYITKYIVLGSNFEVHL